MVEHTRLKELFTKLETVMAVLDQKEEKDRVKDERMTLIEQSLASIAKCMETLQTQQLRTSPSQSTQCVEETVALTEVRP